MFCALAWSALALVVASVVRAAFVVTSRTSTQLLPSHLYCLLAGELSVSNQMSPVLFAVGWLVCVKTVVLPSFAVSLTATQLELPVALALYSLLLSSESIHKSPIAIAVGADVCIKV